ncbi:MAG: YidC/Oxa1 family membrane protein insertase [Candidatus Azambacteria bacterium]|nr:YidC/Oxa1 family membrane protein insertase [Candidatus Azambacteria bacterium]
MISYLFNLTFYQPLFNALIFLYNIIPNHDFGFSIVALTVLIRLALWPLTGKGIRSQKALEKLKPKMEEINKKFKNDKEAKAKALMALYSENKINPLSGFLPLLIQIPIIIALWRVFLNGAGIDHNLLYSFIRPPGEIQSIFLGIFDLTKRNVLLAIIAGALQYFQTKMIMPSFAPQSGATEGKPGSDFSRMMSQQMLYFGPILSIIIFWNLPSALPLYWIVVTLMTLLQQYITQKNDREPGKN